MHLLTLLCNVKGRQALGRESALGGGSNSVAAPSLCLRVLRQQGFLFCVFLPLGAAKTLEPALAKGRVWSIVFIKHLCHDYIVQCGSLLLCSVSDFDL